MTSPFSTDDVGAKSWIHTEGDNYEATGIDCKGRRFKKSGPWAFIASHNIWRGSFWLKRHGRRYLIQRVRN
jgi:hypothetical protein